MTTFRPRSPRTAVPATGAVERFLDQSDSAATRLPDRHMTGRTDSPREPCCHSSDNPPRTPVVALPRILGVMSAQLKCADSLKRYATYKHSVAAARSNGELTIPYGQEVLHAVLAVLSNVRKLAHIVVTNDRHLRLEVHPGTLPVIENGAAILSDCSRERSGRLDLEK